MRGSSDGARKRFPTRFTGFQTPLPAPPPPIHPPAHSPAGPFAHPTARLEPRQGWVPPAWEEAEVALAPGTQPTAGNGNGGNDTLVCLFNNKCGCLPITEENPGFCDGKRGGWWLEASEEASLLGKATALR